MKKKAGRAAQAFHGAAHLLFPMCSYALCRWSSWRGCWPSPPSAHSSARTPPPGPYRRACGPHTGCGVQARSGPWAAAVRDAVGKAARCGRGLYDEEFGLREKLAICGDLRGYTAASGVIRQLSVVFPEKEEVYSSAGFMIRQTSSAHFRWKKGRRRWRALWCTSV